LKFLWIKLFFSVFAGFFRFFSVRSSRSSATTSWSVPIFFLFFSIPITIFVGIFLFFLFFLVLILAATTISYNLFNRIFKFSYNFLFFSFSSFLIPFNYFTSSFTAASFSKDSFKSLSFTITITIALIFTSITNIIIASVITKLSSYSLLTILFLQINFNSRIQFIIAFLYYFPLAIEVQV